MHHRAYTGIPFAARRHLKPRNGYTRSVINHLALRLFSFSAPSVSLLLSAHTGPLPCVYYNNVSCFFIITYSEIPAAGRILILAYIVSFRYTLQDKQTHTHIGRVLISRPLAISTSLSSLVLSSPSAGRRRRLPR